MLEVILKFLAILLIGAFVSITLGGWIVMITAGMVHHEVSSLANVIPAWSFRESVFVSIGLAVLGSYFRTYRSDNKD